jgi:gamma-glutamylcyclotransferase (GGCT)/AIG2-like uncharacterized protein YtfP
MTARRFFFYGTLIAGSANPVTRAIHARMRPLGPATVRGQLHAIADAGGWYPALVAGNGVVRGMLYEALPDFGAADLGLLDAYEGPEYARRATAIEQAAAAEAYWWVAALPTRSEAVPGGDFLDWLRATGRKAWAG